MASTQIFVSTSLIILLRRAQFCGENKDKLGILQWNLRSFKPVSHFLHFAADNVKIKRKVLEKLYSTQCNLLKLRCKNVGGVTGISGSSPDMDRRFRFEP
jgi:hypothetical protein